jgi:UDP-glucose 4-epimerase
MMKRVMVTGAASSLGRSVLEQLRRTDGLQHIYGVESGKNNDRIEDVEFVSLSTDHREMVSFLSECDIDSVIQCNLAPDRCGNAREPAEAKVIETMRLGAAVSGKDTPVRSWVVVSSSAVYPVSSHAPLLHREDGATDATEGSISASLVEAEEYVRDVAARCGHLNVAILRLQQLVGEGVRSPISEVLCQPVLPSVIGFDAALQLLSIEDATRAVVFAAKVELAGVYNVASAGMIRMSEVARELDRPSVPVLPLEAGPFSGLARRVGVPHVPSGMLGTLRFGHAVDTSKIAAAGFTPEYDQSACLEMLRD